MTRHTPFMATKPPASWILFFSLSWQGLWSYDMATARPLSLPNTARESPTLATQTLPPSCRARMSVVPENMEAQVLSKGKDDLLY